MAAPPTWKNDALKIIKKWHFSRKMSVRVCNICRPCATLHGQPKINYSYIEIDIFMLTYMLKSGIL
jgi:hypothetical protein